MLIGKQLAGLRLGAAVMVLASNLVAGAGWAGPAATPRSASSPPAVRLLDSQPGEILVELVTGDYVLEAVSQGGQDYVRLTLPGTELTAEPGAPQVPVAAAQLGVPTLAGLSLSVVAQEPEVVTGLRLAPAP
jgi:hypothetical protein